jgi:hypothetical protein
VSGVSRKKASAGSKLKAQSKGNKGERAGPKWIKARMSVVSIAIFSIYLDEMIGRRD